MAEKLILYRSSSANPLPSGVAAGHAARLWRGLVRQGLADEERYKTNFSAIGDACPKAAGNFVPPRAAAGV